MKVKFDIIYKYNPDNQTLSRFLGFFTILTNIFDNNKYALMEVLELIRLIEQRPDLREHLLLDFSSQLF